LASSGTFNGTNPIKTYLDGVELANPAYLSQIDPKSIERIEILTGPQASTIYGSNALNGVMQIFTKRGKTSHPQLTLSLLSGIVENNFSSARTPQHDYSAQLSGLEGRMSYNAGGSWNFVGAWSPAKRTTRTNAYTGLRFDLPTSMGPLNADATYRQSNTSNFQRGLTEQTTTELRALGLWNPVSVPGVSEIGPRKLTAQTVGLTVGYSPTSWWSHEFGLGRDQSQQETRNMVRMFRYPGDSTVGLYQLHYDRRSLRYTTTARVPVTSFAQATVTLGTDAWNSLSGNTFATGTRSLREALTGVVYNQQAHNTGGFVQTQLGVRDHLFLTYGLRAEWNPDFGADANPNYAPRYGVAYSTDIGPVSAKLRVSYGRSTRPPGLDQKTAVPITSDNELRDVYGIYDTRLANPDLGPEYQQGGEGGVELYFGDRASLVITHYNQTVDGLIVDVPGADSVRSLTKNPIIVGGTCADAIRYNIPTWCSSQDAEGYAYAQVSQNLNVAGIRNQGWELQGSVVMGPITTKGTYSWTKSRSLGLTPKFRKFASSLLVFAPQYRPGATFQFLPEHTWALGTTYARGGTTVAFNVTWTGPLLNNENQYYLSHLAGEIRLNTDRLNYRNGNPRLYYASSSAAYLMADMTASHRFSPHAEAVFEAQNLANHYSQDLWGGYAAIGRQMRGGLRIRL
jgi:outer membrane receptor protein involved in Fe transport